jgi:hypothetical protein
VVVATVVPQFYVTPRLMAVYPMGQNDRSLALVIAQDHPSTGRSKGKLRAMEYSAGQSVLHNILMLH